MKALVLEREGRKAVLLLPGGEMRTVRARKGWETGMEVSVKPYPVRKKRRKVSPRAVLYPLSACTAALLIVLFGLNRLGGGHIDRQHPVQILSSGSPSAVQPNVPEQTAEPTATDVPAPRPTPETAANTAEPTALPEADAHSADTDDKPVQMILPTPMPEICDECGETGHDDDDCPNEQCDECGKTGHDDDDCPNEQCDECGETGHDDDDCPNEQCDECGETGHDDDDCPNEQCDECGETGHDDDDCPNEQCDECGETGHDDDDCPNEQCDECGKTGHNDDHCPDERKGSHHDN